MVAAAASTTKGHTALVINTAFTKTANVSTPSSCSIKLVRNLLRLKCLPAHGTKVTLQRCNLVFQPADVSLLLNHLLLQSVIGLRCANLMLQWVHITFDLPRYTPTSFMVKTSMLTWMRRLMCAALCMNNVRKLQSSCACQDM